MSCVSPLLLHQKSWHTAQGDYRVPTVSQDQYNSILATLASDYYVCRTRITEMASIGLSMIVRHSLGFTSVGGQLGFIIDDSLSGEIALAAARHLYHGGSNIYVVVIGNKGELGASITNALSALQAFAIPIEYQKEHSHEPCSMLSDMLISVHQIITGMTSSIPEPIFEAVNDSVVPVHSLFRPIKGTKSKEFLMCSTTLSVGAPLTCLFNSHREIGTHYLTTACFPEALFDSSYTDIRKLFALQPVIALEEKDN